MYAQHPVDTAAVLRLLLPLLGALGLAAVADGQVFRVAPSFGAGARPVALAAADLDGDGAIDLAVANGTSRDLSILIGDGHGGFVTRSGPRDLFGLTSVAAADFDHDGHADVAVGTLSAASIFLGDGAGGFGPAHACGRGGPMAVTYS